MLLHLAAVQAEAGELAAAQATWERAKKLKLDPSLLHPLERVMYASVAKRLVPPVAVERP